MVIKYLVWSVPSMEDVTMMPSCIKSKKQSFSSRHLSLQKLTNKQGKVQYCCSYLPQNWLYFDQTDITMLKIFSFSGVRAVFVCLILVSCLLTGNKPFCALTSVLRRWKGNLFRQMFNNTLTLYYLMCPFYQTSNRMYMLKVCLLLASENARN